MGAAWGTLPVKRALVPHAAHGMATPAYRLLHVWERKLRSSGCSSWAFIVLLLSWMMANMRSVTMWTCSPAPLLPRFP